MMNLEDLPPVKAFGEWDAPLTDGADWLPEAPTNLLCMHCREHFAPHDDGAVMPTGFATHRNCHLRAVMGGIGHLVDHARYCRGELGPDAGLPYRASATLVWEWFTNGERFTVEDLENTRRELIFR